MKASLFACKSVGQSILLSAYAPATLHAQEIWTGPFVGIHGGLGNIETNGVSDNSSISHTNDLEDATILDQFELFGPMAGFSIGGNLQLNN